MILLRVLISCLLLLKSWFCRSKTLIYTWFSFILFFKNLRKLNKNKFYLCISLIWYWTDCLIRLIKNYSLLLWKISFYCLLFQWLYTFWDLNIIICRPRSYYFNIAFKILKPVNSRIKTLKFFLFYKISLTKIFESSINIIISRSKLLILLSCNFSINTDWFWGTFLLVILLCFKGRFVDIVWSRT